PSEGVLGGTQVRCGEVGPADQLPGAGVSGFGVDDLAEDTRGVAREARVEQLLALAERVEHVHLGDLLVADVGGHVDRHAASFQGVARVNAAGEVFIPLSGSGWAWES